MRMCPTPVEPGPAKDANDLTPSYHLPHDYSSFVHVSIKSVPVKYRSSGSHSVPDADEMAPATCFIVAGAYIIVACYAERIVTRVDYHPIGRGVDVIAAVGVTAAVAVEVDAVVVAIFRLIEELVNSVSPVVPISVWTST